MGKLLKKAVTVLCAFLSAFLILCLLVRCYHRGPGYEPNPLENTDFVWTPGGSWFHVHEGVSWGRMDDRGFNNPTAVQNPDIVIVGSSHMENTYVTQDRLLSVQLQNRLGDRATVYNMGISGGRLSNSLSYLPKTLEAFEKPPRLILMEAFELGLTEQTVQQILDGEIPSIYHPTSSWKGFLLQFPYVGKLLTQMNLGLWDLLNPPRKPAPAPIYEPPTELLPADAPEGQIYDPIFARLRELKETYGTEILIFYYPSEDIREDGSLNYPQDPWLLVFQKKCRENGIGFLNVTENFYELYEQEHKLPHGFITGEIGAGHLNGDGLRTIADAICQWIREKEAGI